MTVPSAAGKERSVAPPPDEAIRLWRLAFEGRGILRRLGSDAARLRRLPVSAAAATGAMETDLLFPGEPDPVVLLARGWSAREIFELALGRGESARPGEPFPAGGAMAGACDPARGVFAPGSLPAAALPVAVGALLATRKRTPPVAAIVLVGPGGTASGDFHEGMNFAAVRGVPLLAIVLGQETVPDPVFREAALDRLSDRAEAYGIPGDTVSGGDLFAVRDAVAQALWRARAGAGPAILEVVLTDEAGYGCDDALARCRSRLVGESHATETHLADIERTIESTLDEAMHAAGGSPEAIPHPVLSGVTAPSSSQAACPEGS